jgi:hypothetical protein
LVSSTTRTVPHGSTYGISPIVVWEKCRVSKAKIGTGPGPAPKEMLKGRTADDRHPHADAAAPAIW